MLVNLLFRGILPACGLLALALWALTTFNIGGPLWPWLCKARRRLLHDNRYQLPEAEA